MRPRLLQTIVIRMGRPLTPSQPIRRPRRFYGRCGVARIAFELAEHIVGIGVEERVWPALGGVPDLIQQFAGLRRLALLPGEFRECGKGGQFFFDEVDFAGAFEGVVQALLGEFVLLQAESGLALAAGGAYEVGFVSVFMRKFPSAIGVGLFGLLVPEVVLGEEGVLGTLTLNLVLFFEH